MTHDNQTIRIYPIYSVKPRPRLAPISGEIVTPDHPAKPDEPSSPPCTDRPLPLEHTGARR